jgi:hypothetical protein
MGQAYALFSLACFYYFRNFYFFSKFWNIYIYIYIYIKKCIFLILTWYYFNKIIKRICFPTFYDLSLFFFLSLIIWLLSTFFSIVAWLYKKQTLKNFNILFLYFWYICGTIMKTLFFIKIFFYVSHKFWSKK